MGFTAGSPGCLAAVVTVCDAPFAGNATIGSTVAASAANEQWTHRYSVPRHGPFGHRSSDAQLRGYVR